MERTHLYQCNFGGTHHKILSGIVLHFSRGQGIASLCIVWLMVMLYYKLVKVPGIICRCLVCSINIIECILVPFNNSLEKTLIFYFISPALCIQQRLTTGLVLYTHWFSIVIYSSIKLQWCVVDYFTSLKIIERAYELQIWAGPLN